MPVVFVPLMARPVLGIAAAVAVVAVLLASQSPAYPVALAGIPTIAIALYGSNPLPKGVIAVGLFAWTLIAIAFVVTADPDLLPTRVLLAPVVTLAIALGALMLARLATSPDTSYGTSKLTLYVIQNVTLLVAGIVIGRRRSDFDLWVVAALVVAALSGLVLAYTLARGTAQADVGGRYGLSSAENPIQLGREAATGVILAAFVLLTAKNVSLRIMGLTTMPVVAVALIASGSRGPALGLLIGLLILVWTTGRDRAARRRLLLLAIGAVAAALFVVQLVPGQNIGRAFAFLQGNGSGLSSTGRATYWSHAYESFANHPITGLGTGGFTSVGAGEVYPHDLLLEVASELGLPGLVLVVGLLVAGIARIRRAWALGIGNDRRRVSLVATLFAAALTNALVSGDLPTNATLWLMLGLALGLSTLLEDEAGAAGAEPA
ncbi:MAG: O-antigen ligase family protein [Actinomycetota bacterium]|nr:O-antigen ligase family protein [Actinomycetota bacterium]